jgi:hypothetical protein
LEGTTWNDLVVFFHLCIYYAERQPSTAAGSRSASAGCRQSAARRC